MAPIAQTAAVCLAALCSLQSAQAQATVTGMKAHGHDELVLAINLARAGGLATALVQVKETEEMVSSAVQAISNGNFDKATCQPQAARGDGILPDTLKGMVLTYTTKQAKTTTPDYKGLVQAVLDKGLTALKSQGGVIEHRGWDQFWKKHADTANLGYLLWSGSVAVGCAVTVGCDDSQFLILCRFNPTAQGNVDAFDENVYNALLARRTPITQMSKGDLQSPGSGATMGVPSLFLAGSVAALAMMTVRG